MGTHGSQAVVATKPSGKQSVSGLDRFCSRVSVWRKIRLPSLVPVEMSDIWDSGEVSSQDIGHE